MELKRLTGWECTVSTTAVGTSPAVIKLALGAADVSGNKVTPRANLNTDFSDFQHLWWVGDRVDGGFVAVKIFNALATGGLSIQTGKNVKGQFSLEIRGHVSIEAQDVVPMEFYSVEAPQPTPPTP